MSTDIRFDEITEDRYLSMVAWCNDQFGRAALWPQQLTAPESPTTWYTTKAFDKNEFGVKNDTGRARFSFKSEKEATLFSLRWGDAKDQK
jgi:hypothetical protein